MIVVLYLHHDDRHIHSQVINLLITKYTIISKPGNTWVRLDLVPISVYPGCDVAQYFYNISPLGKLHKR